jgi:hypothetical protein
MRSRGVCPFRRKRLGGASWSDLGEVLGISKQAVQQRYGELEQDWREELDVAELVGTNAPTPFRAKVSSPRQHIPNASTRGAKNEA